MQLAEYPAQIAARAIALAELETSITRLKIQIEILEDDADRATAHAENLKNDLQRKVFRAERLDCSKAYQLVLEDLLNLTQQKAIQVAKLEQLRSEFSVAKIEARRAIANRLAGVEDREMAGLDGYQ